MEIYAIGTALQVAQEHSSRWRARGVQKVVIFTDAQAALARVQHNRIGAGQAMASRTIQLDARLHELGFKVEYRLVPDTLAFKAMM